MGLLSELRRRNVIRVAIAYAIAAWLLIEVTATTFPMLRLPEWTATFVTVLLIIGFPLALIFAWAYELTPEGVKLEKDVVRSESITHITGRKLDFIIITVLVLALGYFAFDKFVLDPRRDAELLQTTTEAVSEQAIDAGKAETPDNSIAVLPFVNMSPDPEQEYFSDGIAEELLNQLTKLRGLQVAGRTSSFAFKGKNEDLRAIGEKLNVAHILEGSVRKAGDRVRITVQLVKVSDGYHLWSETYDRNLTDIFAIQEETALAVADALSITLGVGAGDLGVGGTRNFEAYDAYLAGVALTNQFGRESISRGIVQFEKAVALDPEFANAWSALAGSYEMAAYVFISERAPEFSKKSEAAALRAIELAPEAVASLRAAAQIHSRNRDWTKAEQSLEKALELAPADYWTNSLYGQFLLRVGRSTEAIDYWRQAVSIEPLDVLPFLMLTYAAHELSGDFDEASKQYEHGKGLVGDQALLNGAIFVLAMVMEDRALIEESLEKIANVDLLSPNSRSLHMTIGSLLDSPDAARTELHRFFRDPTFDFPHDRNLIAIWASYFGDHDLALKAFLKSSEERVLATVTIWRPIHKGMRRLPGFKDLVWDHGLVDYWRASGNWGDFCRPIGDNDFECQ